MGRFGSAASFREGCVSGRPLESEQGALQNVPRCVLGRVQVRPRGASSESDFLTALWRGAPSESDLSTALPCGASRESDSQRRSLVERPQNSIF